ncbi:diphthine methyl ester synthase [Tetranychus urticae]|uniref:diphthine methyl ester synthase n=1 Tax=Tetranychus urticae TaxID=32264 RepID=T1K602_TETUR|nr:diphthine methyl ester synthase [Tetranychus urticae]
MLYLIGLGLCDLTDITVKGLEIVKKCEKVYLEHYTSVLYNVSDNIEKLEDFYSKKVLLADREMVESQSDEILDGSVDGDIAFLVVGDPLGATTHTDLILRAIQRGIKYKIVHNASIMNAVGCCGLQLYNFGETVSIPLWTENWKPSSFMDKILANKKRGLHTLCLLDIKVKEKSLEAMMKGKVAYEPPRFMKTNEAASQIIESFETLDQKEYDGVLDESSYCIGLARVGSDDQSIVRCGLSQMVNEDLGKPLHCLVIEGNLHPLEADMLALFTK